MDSRNEGNEFIEFLLDVFLLVWTIPFWAIAKIFGIFRRLLNKVGIRQPFVLNAYMRIDAFWCLLYSILIKAMPAWYAAKMFRLFCNKGLNTVARTYAMLYTHSGYRDIYDWILCELEY